MIKLTIYGRLRKFIGQSTFEIDVESPRQAFSFLINNFDGVADHIKTQEYCVMAGKARITEDLLDLQTESDIKIIPVVHGELINFIVGGALALMKTSSLSFIAGLKIGSAALAVINAVGISMVLQGVSELLFPPPTPPSFGGTDEQDPSFTFDGTNNISKQGVPINIVFGETLIGTNTISANIDTLQVVNSQ
tara:strand:+ start:56 stop:631 length:576 start_codon:yes stop_codon:yes gene_type:complete